MLSKKIIYICCSLTSLLFAFGCSTSKSGGDDSWNRIHGTIPVISEDGKTLTYGLYPQSHVNNPEQGLIDAGKDKANEEYFIYNNEYYVKDTGNPYSATYTFLDGTKVVKGSIYYFKCEAITWNIISFNNGTYSLDCSNILNAHCYDDSYSNNYKNSDIRAWLNNDFYNKAFFLNNSYIQTVTVDNSASTTDDPNNQYACENTNDKIYLRSYQDWVKVEQSLRKKKVSDFAICNRASMFNDSASSNYRNGWYWTRSPYSGYLYFAWYVDTDCGLDCIYAVSGESRGCSPSLTISI